MNDGYDLFLTSNGVILIYDDLPCDYFEIVDQFPYLVQICQQNKWTQFAS